MAPDRLKPAWMTDELSQEWITAEDEQQDQRRRTIRDEHDHPHSQRPDQSNSISKTNHTHSSASAEQSHSNKISAASIVLNQPDSSAPDYPPPWIKAAVDGMTNEVLGKGPNQLQKIFRSSSNCQSLPFKIHSSHQLTHYDLPISYSSAAQFTSLIRPPGYTQQNRRDSSDSNKYINNLSSTAIDRLKKSFDSSSSSFHLKNNHFHFSIPRPTTSLRSLTQLHTESLSPEQSSSPSSLVEPSLQSIVDKQEQPSADDLPSFDPLDPHQELFHRDSPLAGIAEETEPSTSYEELRDALAPLVITDHRSSTSSGRPPSLPFAHRTPVFDSQNRLRRIASDSDRSDQHTLPPRPPSLKPASTQNHSIERSHDDSDRSHPKLFRFTYDTFARKHLTRLADEIDGLSSFSTGILKSEGNLKLKSILGSPGEELTTTCSSVGLAHSTPPAMLFAPSTNEKRVVHAGRTPFRTVTTNLTQRLHAEKDWRDSFTSLTPYAIQTQSVFRHKRRSDSEISSSITRDPTDQAETTDDHLKRSTSSGLETDPQPSLRSTKRIRLAHSLQQPPLNTRRMRDSVMVAHQRKDSQHHHQHHPVHRIHPHPMIVFRKSSPAAIEHNDQRPRAAVRDRLAEAKALMERIRAKTSNTAQEVIDAVELPVVGEKRNVEKAEHASPDQDQQIQWSSPVRPRNPTPWTASSNRTGARSDASSELAKSEQQEDGGEDLHQDEISFIEAPPGSLVVVEEYPEDEFPEDDEDDQPMNEEHNSEFTWEIGIDDREEDDREVDEERGQDEEEGVNALVNSADDHHISEEREEANDNVHRRLASSAAASLRQALQSDGPAGWHQPSPQPKLLPRSESAGQLTTAGLEAVVIRPKRQFATQPVSRESTTRGRPGLELGLKESTRKSSSSTALSTTTSSGQIPTTSQRTSLNTTMATTAHDTHPKPNPKMRLMTIGPRDVEDLLQNARVGKMVFDSLSGKWIKARTQSETVGLTSEQEEAGAEGVKTELESSDEDDIFKDIESLNSKRDAEISGRASTALGRSSSSGVIGTKKSALKTNENSNSSVSQDENKTNRSVSFQDGRKNGKIIMGIGEKTKDRRDMSVEVKENQSIVLMSCTKKVRRKSSRLTDSSPTIDYQSSTDCSFGLNYERLVRLITDVEPFEPYWSTIKVIDLSEKKLDSIIKLKEILPFLDQVDLHSNQLNYLNGLPESIRMLIAYDNQLNDLSSFGHLKNLERLDLSRNSLSSLQQLSSLKHLRELKIDDNEIEDLSGLNSLDGLVKLSLRGNRLNRIKFESTNWSRLEVLNLDRNQIVEMSGLHKLSAVYSLNVDRNELYTIEFEELMPNLRVLRLSENRLEKLDVSKLVNLRTLYVDNNDLIEIVGASRLRKLENLSVRDQRGSDLSLPMKQVRDVKRMYLGGNPIPTEFPTYQFFNLVYLELAMCQWERLPKDFSRLIPNVRTLNLNYNFIKDINPLKDLVRLEKLTILGSRLKMIDRGLIEVLESLVELELLDLRQNPLTSGFYPPLMIDSKIEEKNQINNNGIEKSKLIGLPHLNQYQIGTNLKNDWMEIDERFRKSLPNEFYLRRMTYRSIIIGSCKRLKSFDGIKVGEIERRKSIKFLRGINKKIESDRATMMMKKKSRRSEEEENQSKVEENHDQCVLVEESSNRLNPNQDSCQSLIVDRSRF